MKTGVRSFSRSLHRVVLPLCLAQALVVSAAPTKTFIVFGGGTADSTPQEILDQSHLFADLPIDGIAIRVQGRNAAGRALSVDYDMRAGEPWQFDFFADQIPIVREIVTKPGLHQSLLDSFRILTTRMRWDDDAGWALFAHNFAVHAKVAKACGLKGMLIDCEDYHKILQFFLADGDGSYEETAALARRRGRELFEGAFRAFPEMTLLSFWFLSLDPDYAETADPVALAKVKGDLWPAFVNGLLDVLPSETTLVDGSEHGYCYEADRNDFYRSAAAVRDTLIPLVAPENRRKYRNQMRASHGVWPDMYWYAKSSPSDRWSFDDRPEDRLSHWERNLFQAADAADECLWIFCSRSRLVDWKISHPRYGRAMMAKRPLEERLPGAFSVLAAVRDPVAWGKRRMAEMSAKGTLVDLAATGEASARQDWGYYVWDLSSVRPGEYYAVCAEGRGGDAAETLWVRLGKPDEKTAAVPWLGNRRQPLATAADGLRHAMDVVRIPDAGASRLQVLLPGLSTNALPKVKFKPSKLTIHRLPFID